MFENCLENVRWVAPLVHNITNYVTVNDVANVLLPCGASPIMADDEGESADITSIYGGTNINIGTLNKNTIPSMVLAGAAVTIIGTIAAIAYPMDNITDFLYLIGSVFAPMIAIQIADFFLLKHTHSKQKANIQNLIIWALGFTAYRILIMADTPVGSTLPDMAITICLCLLFNWGRNTFKLYYVPNCK